MRRGGGGLLAKVKLWNHTTNMPILEALMRRNSWSATNLIFCHHNKVHPLLGRQTPLRRL